MKLTTIMEDIQKMVDADTYLRLVNLMQEERISEADIKICDNPTFQSIRCARFGVDGKLDSQHVNMICDAVEKAEVAA